MVNELSAILRQETKGLLFVYQTESTLRHFGKVAQYEAILENVDLPDLKSDRLATCTQALPGFQIRAVQKN